MAAPAATTSQRFSSLGLPDRALDRLARLGGLGEPQQRRPFAASGECGDGRVRWGVGKDQPPQVERLGVCVSGDRDLCRAGEPLARSCGVLGAERSSEVGVVRDRGARVGVVGMVLLDHSSRAVVQSQLSSRADLAVQRLARERVHEGVARVLLLDQSTGHREVQQVEAAVDREPGELRDQVGVDPATEYGGRGQHRRCLLREPGDALPQDVADAVRHGEVIRRHGEQGGSCREQPGVLQDEERVSPGPVGHHRVQPGVVLTDRASQQLPDGAGVEPVQPDPLGPCPRERGHRVDQCRPGGGLRRTPGAGHDDRCPET